MSKYVTQEEGETMSWQIGVSEIVGSGIRWQDDYVLAVNESEAEQLATDKGYYRNLRVRLAG